MKVFDDKVTIKSAFITFLYVISVVILLLSLKQMGLFSSMFHLPDDSGGWLYEYQILFTGLCALFAAIVAYRGVVKKLAWEEFKEEKETTKIIEDLLADSYEAMFKLVFMEVFINKGLSKEAHEIFIKDSIPLSLGYKFFDNQSIERLESMKRVNARAMVEAISNFNKEFESKNFKKAAEEKDSFLLSYELLFGNKITAMYSLAKNMADLIKEKQDSV